MGPAKKIWICLAIVLGAPGLAVAKVSGPCVDCHTMHNSQGGSPMAFTMSGGTKTPTSVANKGLLTTDCIGCHQGANTGSGTPYVFDANVPTYGTTGTEGNTLAGGNFYWVSTGNDRAGHNVAGITGSDWPNVNIPPGGASALLSQLSCAGTYGCHGSQAEADQTIALFGSHHRNDMSGWQDGVSTATSYRFIDGLQGLEDSDYEYKPVGSGVGAAHNKYYGVDRTTEGDVSGTISSHCARCHNDFHNGNTNISSGTFGNGIWLRHPTDFDMSRSVSSTEYDTYNGGTGTGNPYSVISPVATADTTTILNTTVYSQADDAIVMCLSCHRAHGTPYDGILRWDYKKWPGIDGYNGCAICHTTKN